MHKFAQTKTAVGNEKVPRIPIEAGCQVSHVGRHIEEPAVFVSAVVHIFRIGSAVRHCACNPLSQNTNAHITTVAMDDVIGLGRRSHRASFAFGSYFSRLIAANSTQYKSFQVELKMANSKWTYRGKSRAFISFFDAVSCCLIQVQHRIRKKLET